MPLLISTRKFPQMAGVDKCKIILCKRTILRLMMKMGPGKKATSKIKKLTSGILLELVELWIALFQAKHLSKIAHFHWPPCRFCQLQEPPTMFLKWVLLHVRRVDTRPKRKYEKQAKRVKRKEKGPLYNPNPHPLYN